MSSISDIDPLELYDSALEDWTEVDTIEGTNHVAEFLAKFGTREEFAAKITVQQPPEILADAAEQVDEAADTFVEAVKSAAEVLAQ